MTYSAKVFEQYDGENPKQSAQEHLDILASGSHVKQ